MKIDNLSKKIISGIIAKYKTGTFSCGKLAKLYKMSIQSISRILTKNKIPKILNPNKFNRKYTLNHDVLDVIDTEEKAYFLGLFYADGYNLESQNCIRIGLQKRDKAVLNRFKTLFSSNRPIQISKISRKNKNWQDCYVFTLNSQKLSKRLIELGCPQAKSLMVKFPSKKQVPSHLMSHFIRGYFDGDGCITYTNRKRNKAKYKDFNCSIVSTNYFCIGLKKLIEPMLEIHLSIYKPAKYKNKITARLQIGGNKQIEKFLNFIYKDSSICLSRKYKKYQSVKSR